MRYCTGMGQIHAPIGSNPHVPVPMGQGAAPLHLTLRGCRFWIHGEWCPKLFKTQSRGILTYCCELWKSEHAISFSSQCMLYKLIALQGSSLVASEVGTWAFPLFLF